MPYTHTHTLPEASNGEQGTSELGTMMSLPAAPRHAQLSGSPLLLSRSCPSFVALASGGTTWTERGRGRGTNLQEGDKLEEQP